MAGKLTVDKLADKSVFEIGELIEKGLAPASPALKKFADDAAKYLDKVKQQAIEFANLEKQYKVAPNRKEFNTLLQKQSGLIEQNNALRKEQDRLERALISAIAKRNLATESTNRALGKQRLETQRLNKNIKQENILTSRSSSLIEKITVKRARAVKIIQDLNAKKALGVKLSDKEQKELKQSIKEYSKYNRAIKIAKNSTGQFQENVGNYPNTFGIASTALRSFIPLVGAGFGLKGAWDFTRELYNTAKEAKGVEFAFEKLGYKGQEALEKVRKSTRGLLSDLDIKRSLVEFDNFNLSLEQTNTLFEFLAVRATQTGRSVDSLKDSLVEGLSKESKLRIDNLGISAAELNKELEKTPDFVQAVANIAKREISQAGDILEESADAQQRFNAELENFKVSAGSGFVRRFTDSVYDLGTAFLNVLRNANDVSEIIGEIEDYGFWDGYLAKPIQDFIRLRNASAEYRGILKEYENIDLSSINEIQAGIDIWTEMKDEVKENAEVVKILDFFINKLKKSETLYYENARDEHDKMLKNSKKREKELSEKEKREQERRRREAERRKKQLEQDAYNLQKFRIEQEIKGLDEIAKSEENSYFDRIKAIQAKEEKQIELSELTEKHLLSNSKLSADQRILIEEQTSAKLVDIYKDTNDAIDKLKEDALNNAPELIDVDEIQPDIELIKQGIKDYAKSLGFDGAEALEEFEKLHGDKFENIKQYFDSLDERAKKSAEYRKQLEKGLFNAISDFTNVLFERKIQGIEDEIIANNERYDNAINTAQDRYDEEGILIESADRRRDILEQERRKKEKELEKKKRKEQRKQAIFNKATSVFEIGINTASSIMKMGSQLGVYAIPFQVASAALGALQIATVLAQPLPKYKFGRKGGKAEWAITGDGGVNEVIERKKGGFELTPAKDTLTYLEKGDTVHSSIDAFAESKGLTKKYYDDLERNVILGNLYAQAQKANDYQQAVIINNKIDEQFVIKAIQQNNVGLKKEIQNGFKNIVIHNHQNINIEGDGWDR